MILTVGQNNRFDPKRYTIPADGGITPYYRYRDWTIFDSDANTIGWYDGADLSTITTVNNKCSVLADKLGTLEV